MGKNDRFTMKSFTSESYHNKSEGSRMKQVKDISAGSKSNRVKEYQVKDQSEESSNVQLSASLKGYNSTATTSTTTIKGTT